MSGCLTTTPSTSAWHSTRSENTVKTRRDLIEAAADQITGEPYEVVRDTLEQLLDDYDLLLQEGQ